MTPLTQWQRLVEKVKVYGELTKPRLSFLVVFTTAIGYLLASGWDGSYAHFISVVTATYLIVGGANAFNQILERDTDALMKRTQNRPIPSARISVKEGTVIGATMTAVGSYGLFLLAPLTPAALLALVSLAIYVLIYTPLKRVSWLCTFAGAVSGATPPVIGWFAGGGPLGLVPLLLFAVQYVWQFPHFWAIGRLYRDDYMRAGLKVMSVKTTTIAILSVLSCAALVLLSFCLLSNKPSVLTLGGLVLINGWLATAVIRFVTKMSRVTARTLLITADLWLPCIFLVLIFLPK